MKFLMNRLYLFLAVLAFCSTLVACAERLKPAPIKRVYTGNSIHDYQKGSLKKESYIVKKGETLYSIAFRAGMDFRQLAENNNIKPPYTLRPGQKININLAKKVLTKPQKIAKPVVKDKKTNKNINKSIAKTPREEYGKKIADVNKKLTKQGYNNKDLEWSWPAKGKILAKFSKAEIGNKGLDISGKMGQPIYSAANGKVVYAGNALRGYGNLVIIKHTESYLSAYAHNSRILIKEQDWVKAGQHIADMGNSDSDVVKLHFEVRFQGTTVDPLRYLPKRSTK